MGGYLTSDQHGGLCAQTEPLPVTKLELDRPATGGDLQAELANESGEKPPYRRDIEGLRAIAILCVVLFHFDLGLTGGYVGVDIFFVISGYLITQGLLLPRHLGVRGILVFWARRLRRLVPALVVVSVVTLVVALLLLMPDELVAFGKSLQASDLFYSNYLYYSEAGYFDAPSLTKPFLHTWSLSVEAQFYVAFPLMVILLRSQLMARHKGAIAILCALFTLSFAASIAWVRTNPSLAFYALPARAWELLAGSLLAFGVLRAINNSPANQLLQAVGMVLVAWSAWFYSANTPFPGGAALVPVLGAFLLIYSGQSSPPTAPVSCLLKSKPLVWIGKRAYSLYLWHWPLIVLLPNAFGREPSPGRTVIGVVLAIGLSDFTYRLVERPFNRWQGSHRVKLLMILSVGFLWLASILGSVLLQSWRGLPSRLSKEALVLAAGARDVAPAADRCHTVEPTRIQNADLCKLGAPDVRPARFVVWGDSHAHAMYGAFDRLAIEYGVSGEHASYAACPPLLGVGVATHTSDACQRFNAAMLDYINKHEFRYVFLIARWSVYSSGHTPNGMETGPEPLLVEAVGAPRGGVSATSSQLLFARGMEQTVSRLAAPGRTIYVVEQVPEAIYPLPSSLARATLLFGMGPSGLQPRRQSTEARQNFVTQTLDIMKDRYRIEIVRTHDFLCDAKTCRVVDAGHSLYRDADHLSAYGANVVASILAPVFDEISRAE